MNLISKVLSRNEIIDNPPVLLDVGASGEIHKNWKDIAKHSICIAFDADKRDFDYITEETGNYKKLHIFNCIVTNEDKKEVDFYLTKSPHCSSILEPDNKSLKDWAYSSLFEIENKIKVKTENLSNVLEKLGIKKIDWFKTDSQGIDLRLFKSLGENILEKVLVAEFEPGILDSYKSEDKLHEILSYMDKDKIFWLSDFILKGSQRITSERFDSIFKNKITKKIAMHALKKSPGWAELIFINSFKKPELFSKRDYLLSWVFSTINNQHGFSLFLAEEGLNRFNDNIFSELVRYSKRKIRTEIFSLQLLTSIKNRLFKIFSN